MSLEERVLERIKDQHWKIYVCAEPDGQDCDSGTHPNICSHRCQAIKLFHETRRDYPDDQSKWTPGPQIAEVEVTSPRNSQPTDETLLLRKEILFHRPTERWLAVTQELIEQYRDWSEDLVRFKFVENDDGTLTLWFKLSHYTDEIVERAAAALVDPLDRRIDWTPHYAEFSEDVKNLYRQHARAALRAALDQALGSFLSGSASKT